MGIWSECSEKEGQIIGQIIGQIKNAMLCIHKL